MNEKWRLLQEFVFSQDQQISSIDFLINSGVIIVLALILEFSYIKCSKTISNRRQFAGTFLLLAFTTMLIINIVKSSLALSLGLVGALSIVRFRAAIKEPEELTYLFFTIALGLGLGANQTLIVIIAFAVGMIIIWGKYLFGYKSKSQNLYLNINAKADTVKLDDICQIINATFGKYYLKRFDENDDVIETSFLVDSPDTTLLSNLKKKLEKLGKEVTISFIESKSF